TTHGAAPASPDGNASASEPAAARTAAALLAVEKSCETVMVVGSDGWQMRMALNRAHAPVYGDGLASDVTGSVRRKQHGYALEIVFATEAAQRRPLQNECAALVDRAARHLGRKNSRCDRVRGDAIASPLDGDLAREIDEARLARVVRHGGHEGGIGSAQ